MRPFWVEKGQGQTESSGSGLPSARFMHAQHKERMEGSGQGFGLPKPRKGEGGGDRGGARHN